MPKISELNAITSVANTDLLMVVHDPSGSPSTNKITVNNFITSVSSQLRGYTGSAGSGGGSGNANTSGWLANTVIFANAGGYLSNTNNLQFFSSNNVLQVTTLTTVGTSGNITNVNYISANGITTTGSSGNISGVNYIYANNYIANTGGYFQFADGTNIFVISHKGDQLFEKFRSVIKFEKRNDFSVIV